MLIYIRHSDDEYSNPTYKHDNNITNRGVRLAQKTGKKLIEKYGLPYKIYCSPFRRTRQTLENMLSSLSPELRAQIQISFDNRLCRYFSSSEKRRPKIDPKTKSHQVPITETWEDFKERIDEHIMKMRRHKYKYREEVVWVITHALVYKRVARHHQKELPDYIPFMHYFYLRKKEKRRRHK